MTDQIHSQHQSRWEQPDQPGLEAAPPNPIRYSTAPIPYNPPSEVRSTGEKTVWSTTQPYPAQPPPQSGRRRILGLTVPVFWGIVIALVLVLAGGIAGGVAGGLAAQKSNSPSTPTSPSDIAATIGPESTTSTASTTRSRSSATTAASSTSRAAAPSGVRAAPTDGGCPSINQTAYTPTDANGDAMRVGSGSAQTFQQLCEVNYPSGAAWGNPALYDILKVYVPAFEDCMALCAAHNQAYNRNLANGAVVSAGGYCRSVAMIKLPGEYCYLKNGTGKMDTQGHPKDFISAVVISGLPVA
ncbi:hypothetical protein CH63R_06040 [Colletotrichum higginsianum IMI 349063]|uniref:Uncharacterized protein n=4 Tax=Colletotrichum destructivum species complex TaxID=2707350 RepID=A0A1B7YEV0_COLHI|nr:hypothetical protein CH63R_06040 [Colletotrichum higginsianum IMI 349063]OBR10348.1 hypothetical protein CH63R_06040 [Colletotrichum higginsianum IMI 349063]TID07703.1 hypothetical protein CH35J_001123 [Colletotrichum higginsianum]